jgi:glycosyltransferase involved in cell wall biosynthesis
MKLSGRPLRIIVVCEVWQGSNSYAFARAFRRLGHSVTIVSEATYLGFGWKSPVLRGARRLLMPWIEADFTRDLSETAQHLRPHLLLVCKGPLVTPEALQAVKATGAVAILWWPDISFFAHGPTIPRALPFYDWIFTTKTFGLKDLRDTLGLDRASFMPHAFDPETHVKFPVDATDTARCRCDVSFIGTWSPKKEALLTALVMRRPDIDLKVWGTQWEKARPIVGKHAALYGIVGAEYAKAIGLSSINLGILREVQQGGASGDLITSRTFHIPASGGFMLHERTKEVQDYFVEDQHCAMFGDADEMIAKIEYFLKYPDQRQAIAESGHRRCLASGYSIDDRARSVLVKVAELRS